MSKMFFQSRIEKDFEFFVRSLPLIEPVEFCGLAKILGVQMYKDLADLGLDVEDLKKMSNEELIEVEKQMTVPMDKVLEAMMDKYLKLSKRRRKEINQILKDVKRGK